MAKEGLPVQTSCRVLEVSESGFYEWRNRPPSERSLRHAWPTQLITEVHTASHGSTIGLSVCRIPYGARRVHGRTHPWSRYCSGTRPSELLMRAAGVKTLPGNKLWVRTLPNIPRANEKSTAPLPLDTFSRRVVGWSIAGHMRTELVINAPDMAVAARGGDVAGTIMHSDGGAQGGFNWSKQHVAVELIVGVRPILQREFAIGVAYAVAC